MTDPAPLERLRGVLRRLEPAVIAVSGGVDSLTLAVVAGRALPGAIMAHAASPAVPASATDRVRSFAAREGWTLEVIDAGEFEDPNYLKNPVNRCYFCKSNLYGRIRARMPGTIASGTNTDDLSDFRPGLEAAREEGVVHPFVEAEIDKATLRGIAAGLGLGDVAGLPAQPCLSSRVETGIAISPRDLHFIDRVETLIADGSAAHDIRCRITAGGVRIETDGVLSPKLASAVRALCEAEGRVFAGVAPYRRGSAFLRDRAS